MKTSTKATLIIAIAALILGIVLAGVGISVMGSDFNDLVIKAYTPVTYGVSEDFTNILIYTDVHDISFVLSEDADCKVVCDERERVSHVVTVQNGTLTVKTVNNKMWFDYIGIFSGKTTITVYLPKTEYDTVILNTDTGDIKITKEFSFNTAKIETDTGDVLWYAGVVNDISVESDTGDLNIKDISPASVQAETDTGEITLTTLSATEGISVSSDTGDVLLTDCTIKGILDVKTSTGDVSLANTISGILNIKTTTGDVTFNNADAENLSVKTDTGDVRGTLMTEKIFFPTTDTGKISLPRTTSGGICEINTSTGNIKIDISEK